jgi:hypothetical protein
VVPPASLAAAYTSRSSAQAAPVARNGISAAAAGVTCDHAAGRWLLLVLVLVLVLTV